MRVSFAGLLTAGFALGTLVAPLNALKFNFTDVQQCDPFIINLSGINLDSKSPIPTSLSILPINGSAIDVPLPDPSVISTGISLNFLPLPAGSNFLASLNDGTGDNVIPTSDLMRVLPSQSGNSSCLDPSSSQAQRHFRLRSIPSQCQNFTISYNTSLVSQAPTVRLYVPNGPAFALNNTEDNTSTGRATYLMQGFRGVEIVMLIDDGKGIRETTPLLTIGGDSASDTKCLGNFFNSTTAPSKPASSNSSTALGSKAVIIGAATGGTALLVVIGCMALFVVRERRQRRQSQTIPSDRERMTSSPMMDEGNNSPRIPRLVLPQPLHSPPSTSANPYYTMVSTTPLNFRDDRSSDYSGLARQENRDYPVPGPSPRDLTAGQNSPRGSDNMSIQSLDIEGMLNMATLQIENSHSRKNSSINLSSPLPRSTSSSLALPAPTLRSEGSRRHMRDPSDVPRSPASLNPFDVAGGSRIGSGISGVSESGGIINNYARSPLRENSTSLEAGRRPGELERSDTLASGKSTNYWYGFAR